MFQVRWRPSALKELADLWTNADSAGRRAITEATQIIDRQLPNNPQNQGESRAGGRRIFFAPPLGILFRVEPQQRIARVLQVWLY
jgi:hypothetical protein